MTGRLGRLLPDEVVSPIALSFFVATVATLVAGLLGIAIATSLTARRFPGRNLVEVVLTLPMVLPPTVLGYYLLVVLACDPSGRLESLTGQPIVLRARGR